MTVYQLLESFAKHDVITVGMGVIAALLAHFIRARLKTDKKKFAALLPIAFGLLFGGAYVLLAQVTALQDVVSRLVVTAVCGEILYLFFEKNFKNKTAKEKLQTVATILSTVIRTEKGGEALSRITEILNALGDASRSDTVETIGEIIREYGEVSGAESAFIAGAVYDVFNG